MGFGKLRARKPNPKPVQCRGCPLWDAPGPVSVVVPEGATMAVVGDAPGDEECTKRKVFEGRSGYVLDVALKEAGVPKEEVLLATVVRCMPYRGKDKRKFREPTREEMRFCGERFLEPTLRRVQPNVIVALGGKAMEYFTKGALMGDVNVWRGKVVDVDGSDTHAEEVPF